MLIQPGAPGVWMIHPRSCLLAHHRFLKMRSSARGFIEVGQGAGWGLGADSVQPCRGWKQVRAGAVWALEGSRYVGGRKREGCAEGT